MIVQVVRRLPPFAGGTERQAIKLAGALQDLGHRAVVVGGRIPGTRAGRDILLLPDSAHRYWGTLKYHFYLLQWLEKQRSEIQAVQTFFCHETSLLLAWWCGFRKVPLFFKLATSGAYGDFEAAAKSVRGKWALRAIRKHAAGIIAISSQLEEDARKQGLRNVVCIPNGVSVPKHHASSPAGAGPRLAAAGRLAHQKAFDKAIRAVARVPGVVQLDIYGDGDLRSELEALAADEGCSDRVAFKGWDPELAQKLHNYDGVFITSRAEGLSNVMLEAMAVGTPVVTTPVSGAADAISDGQTGVIANGFQVEDLVNALKRFIAELAGNADVRQTVRRSIEKSFDIDVVARKYQSLYLSAKTSP